MNCVDEQMVIYLQVTSHSLETVMIVRSVLNVSLAPTKKCCKVAKEIALKDSVLYPAFLGEEGPAEQLNPAVNNALDCFGQIL